jgi:hypothetical protein
VVASGVILSMQVGAASVVRNVAGFVPTGFVPTGFVPTGFVPTGFVPTGFVPTGFVRVYHQHGLCSRVGT